MSRIERGGEGERGRGGEGEGEREEREGGRKGARERGI